MTDPSRPTRDDGASRSRYWYTDAGRTQRAVDVLNAMRAYRTAEQAMRKRTRDSMGMNETDIAAIRMLLAAQQHGEAVSPKDLAQRLQISTASVSGMLDRLERSGHVQRRPNPHDGRGLIVTATPGSDEEMRERLGRMHALLLDVAEGLPPEEAEIVIAFLERLHDAVADAEG